jgi:hypothetical protein
MLSPTLTAVSLCRAIAEEDIEAYYTALRGTNLPENVMTPRVAIIYLIQGRVPSSGTRINQLSSSKSMNNTFATRLSY